MPLCQGKAVGLNIDCGDRGLAGYIIGVAGLGQCESAELLSAGQTEVNPIVGIWAPARLNAIAAQVQLGPCGARDGVDRLAHVEARDTCVG